MASCLRFATALSIACLGLGCSAKPTEPAAEAARPEPETPPEPGATAEGSPADGAAIAGLRVADEGPTPLGQPDQAGAAESDPADGPATADDADADDDGTTDAPLPEGDEQAQRIAELVKEIRAKRTRDERAFAALAEAAELGAEPKALAEAATRRARTLLGDDQDRAIAFFVWARDHDPKWPDASFELAKLAAMVGDVEDVKVHLKDVRSRGGKRLLRNVPFDPMFALVASDPDVVKLLK